MKSRRRIAFQGYGLRGLAMQDYSRVFRSAKWGCAVSLRGSNPELFMSALGQKQTLTRLMTDVRFGSKADIAECETNVRFAPKSGHH
jgi:hypothetical protein